MVFNHSKAMKLKTALLLLILIPEVSTALYAQEGKAGAMISFPYTGGWEGADAAYSVPLEKGRTLWLFGDTFVGPSGDTGRKQVWGMPRNSIGIAECRVQKPCQPRYYWTKMATRMPRAFFDTGTDEWYWPMDGFVWKGRLYLMLSRFHAKGTGAFGFESTGAVLATIPNYQASPAEWKVEYQAVLASTEVMPGVSIVLAGKFAYFFTFVNREGLRFTALARLPLERLNKAPIPEGHWQYLTSDGQWKGWRNSKLPGDAKQVMAEGYTEFTVRYHPEEQRWLAVMPSSILEGRGVYSTAPSLEGPWSRPQTLYRYPEMQPGNENYTKNVFCYADKEHPELEEPGVLVFTYACNSTVLDEVMKNPRLYHPVVVTVPMPQ
jgi:hypothetical protein